jgi:hypothetical protein
MFTFNGKQFAPLKAKETTGDGYYRRSKKGVYLYDKDRRLQAYAQANDQFTGIVTAYIYDGRACYMNGLDSISEQWLGLDQLGYAAERETVTQALLGG